MGVSVKVSNLPYDTSPDNLRELFVSHGVDSMTDCYIPQGKQFGFLRFAGDADARCVLMLQVSYEGNDLVTEIATSKKRGSEDISGGPMGRGPMGRGLMGMMGMPPMEMWRSAPREAHFATPAPDVGGDEPSIKVSSLPRERPL